MEKAKSSADMSLVPLLDTIQEQTEYANRIVTDVQDYARTVNPKFSQVDLAKLFEQTLSTLEIPKTVKVSTEVDQNASTIQGDSGLLRRALANVMANALQAMPKGGRMTINTSRLEKAAIIKIQDSGEGISPDMMTRVFNPLFTTRARGIGLGLPIAKRLVEAHGGKIAVTSRAGRGTLITIELPIVQNTRMG